MATSKFMASHGAVEGILAHNSLSSSAIVGLIPVSIGTPAKIERKTQTSISVLIEIQSTGAHTNQEGLPVYGSRSEGLPRALDNSDLLRGAEPIYEDIPHLRHLISGSLELANKIRDAASPYPTLLTMCNQDMDKLTIQKGKHTAWFLVPPMALDLKKDDYAATSLSVLSEIVDVYAGTAPPMLGHPCPHELMLKDFDPPDTSTGMPTLASGARTMPARFLTAKAAPSPSSYDDPTKWLAAYDRLGPSIGLPLGTIYAAVLATRQGPTRKPTPAWYRTGGGFRSEYETYGLYPRKRFVYPIPQIINMMTSPLYLQMKHARQHILGLWHTPDLMSKYIQHMHSQLGEVYTIDFSGMDTTMPPHCIAHMCDALVKVGFAKWHTNLLKEVVRNGSVLMPSFDGDFRSVTRVSHRVSWFSGFKLTSEMDTLYGLWTFLAALQCQVPDIMKRWKSGNFVVAELGDDIVFKLKDPLDIEQLAKDAKAMTGANLKVLAKDQTFLKMWLPITDASPINHITRPLSRLIQQSAFNEDVYTGTKGGAKPDAILRLGLQARGELCVHHPLFKKVWPDVTKFLNQLGYIGRSLPSYKSGLSRGDFSLQPGDDRDILEYATANPDFISALQSRAQVEPSATAFLALLGKYVPVDRAATALGQRAILYKALFESPSAWDFQKLREDMEWLRR